MKRRDALKLAALLPLAGCASPRTQAPQAPASPTPGSTATMTQAQTSTVRVTAGPARASISELNPNNYQQAPTTFGMHMPGIADTVPTTAGARTIALTFDACNGEVDQALIDTLRAHRVPATLFLARPWIEANPEAARHLIADPLFKIGNHGTRHLPLSVNGQAAYGIAGTENPAAAIAEVAGNEELLRSLGADPLWFRTGTAHYDDVAVRIANDGGVKIAGFSVNGDYGATAAASEVAQNIVGAPDGSIVLAHMNHPQSGTSAGVARALESMGQTRFVLIDGTRP